MYSSHAGDQTAYEMYAKGSRFLADGHPHQAVMYLSRAKALEPEKGSIREALGRALFMIGHPRRARREFTKAVALNPADDYAHFALGLACARTGQRERARGHLKLAVAMRPGVEDYERALRRIAG